jgi:hypothetical protein
MKPATQDQADQFARAMAAKFHARIIRKDMAIEMQILAAGFDVLRAAGVQVPVGGDFLDHYATTLGPLVYMPSSLTPDQQIEVLTHELEHVRQFWVGDGQAALPNAFGMGWLYLTDGEARARFEAEAYRAALELAHARGAPVPSLDDLAYPLEGGYALDDGGRALARDLLEVAATSVAAGVVSTDAAREAIAWLRTNAPELLA